MDICRAFKMPSHYNVNRVKHTKIYNIVRSVVMSDRHPKTVQSFANKVGMYIPEKWGIQAYEYFIENIIYYESVDMSKHTPSEDDIFLSNNTLEYLMTRKDVIHKYGHTGWNRKETIELYIVNLGDRISIQNNVYIGDKILTDIKELSMLNLIRLQKEILRIGVGEFGNILNKLEKWLDHKLFKSSDWDRFKFSIEKTKHLETDHGGKQSML